MAVKSFVSAAISGIRENINTILDKDPAARSPQEVFLCYPGFHAVTVHRLSHWLWRRKQYTIARFISHLSRIVTGIEIHPGAKLGARIFIDHGMGVVIGETAELGDDVVIYQGVTLGAGAEARMGSLTRGKKRHPTLGNGVIVGSGAEIQGDIRVGDNARVASGSIVLKEVPPNSIVIGVPGRVVYRDGQKVKDEDLDIEAEAIKSLKERIAQLEKQISDLNSVVKPSTKAQADHKKQKTIIDTKPDPVEIFLNGAGI